MLSNTFDHIRRIVRWPFSSRLASPIWFGLRIYLGTVWLQFGVAKLQSGWLTDNPMADLLTAIANGHTAAPFPGYAAVADLLLRAGADHVMSIAIPLAEVGVAAAFFGGVLLVPAAVGACLLNVNLILSGIATWSFDGRIIMLQLLLLLAWRVAGFLGLAQSLRELWAQYRSALAHPRRHGLQT